MNSKPKILEEALNLFAKKGYSATSVKEIAEAVGIKAPSLYNHFASKQKIFEALVDMMLTRFSSKSGNENGSNIKSLSQSYADGGIMFLKTIAHDLFHYYLSDPYASKFSKMLSIERYNSVEVNKIYLDIFINAPIAYQSNIFKELIALGYLKESDPDIMAYYFFSPVFVLLDKYENNVEDEQTALMMLDKHIEEFVRIYSK